MSEKIIRIKSGNEEFTMSVTEEEYLKYYRPWWQMKKKEQRNREAMELNGYTEESYEEWKENDMRTELFAESMEELAEKRMLLDVLRDAMDSLLPEERELAMKVFGEEMSIYKDLRIPEKSIGEGMRKTPTSIYSHWRCSRISPTRWRSTPTRRFPMRWTSGWTVSTLFQYTRSCRN